jgi:dienelactone hydrolase
VRTLALSRGADRPLRTLVFYPAATPTGPASKETAGEPVEPRRNASPAASRFPLVLFSHGLRGTTERYAPAAATWAAAGFVVAAPAYPHTNEHAKRYNPADIVNQPGDAAYVIKNLRRLDRTPGDPLNGHIDVDRVAAVGHSAGGYTTIGLFAGKHPSWLRAGVVIAGWPARGAFAGPPATMLFLQGDHDTVVPPAQGRTAYDAVPWVKSFVLLPDSGHADYMVPGGHAYAEMDRLVIDFLRRTLDDEVGEVD